MKGKNNAKEQPKSIRETSPVRLDKVVVEKVKKKKPKNLTTKAVFELGALAFLKTGVATHYRSAKTGLYVEKKEVYLHPESTVTERDKV